MDRTVKDGGALYQGMSEMLLKVSWDHRAQQDKSIQLNDIWPPNIRLLAPSLSSFVSILQYARYGLPAAPPMYVSACTDLW